MWLKSKKDSLSYFGLADSGLVDSGLVDSELEAGLDSVDW